MTEKKRPGRKRDKLPQRILIRYSIPARDRWEKAAAKVELSLTEWIRMVCNAAAG